MVFCALGAIYFPPILVLIWAAARDYAIFYLSADLQTASTFCPRVTSLATAQRAGRDGFVYDRPSWH
jgi:hypothetical protein